MKDDREALQTPLRFDATRSGAGSRLGRNAALLQRAAFNATHELQLRPRATVLRWLEVPDSGAPWAGVAPTTIPVEGLENLPVVMGNFKHEEVLVDGEFRRRTLLRVMFWPAPRTQALEGDTLARVLLTDKVEVRGEVYDVAAVDFQEETGRCEVDLVLTPTRETA